MPSEAVAAMVKSLLSESEDVPGAWAANGLVIIKPRTNYEGGINLAEWVRGHGQPSELPGLPRASFGLLGCGHLSPGCVVQRRPAPSASRAGGSGSRQPGGGTPAMPVRDLVRHHDDRRLGRGLAAWLGLLFAAARVQRFEERDTRWRSAEGEIDREDGKSAAVTPAGQPHGKGAWE